MVLLNVLLQAAPGGAEGPASYTGILMIVAMVAIFYFFMIRPQQRRQKEILKAREAMKNGDKVIVAGGIHGRIKEIGDTNMIIEISEGVRIRVEKGSVFASADDLQAK